MAISEISNRTHPALNLLPGARLASGLPRVRSVFAEWHRRRDYRRELRRLLCTGRHMIADVGLTCEAAWREAEKPFWQR